MEEFCQNEHDIDYTITFYPDCQKKIRITGITIENLPIKLPDAKARQFYSNYVILIGNIYYPGYRYENKHFITGTRVYSCNEITNHILRHIISLEDTYGFATATNHITKKKTYKPPPKPSTKPTQPKTRTKTQPEQMQEEIQTEELGPPQNNSDIETEEIQQQLQQQQQQEKPE